MSRKITNWAILIIGAIGAVFGLTFPFAEARYGGVIFGISFIAFFFELDRLVNKRYDQKHPVEAKQKKIEVEDERNTMIRIKAKAVSGDIAQWLVMAAAYCNILADGALWLTLLLVGIFAVKSILDFTLRMKYDKVM